MSKLTDVKIHPTSIIGKNVKIGSGSSIGAYCIIGLSVDGSDDSEGEVVIGPSTIIGHHTVIYENVVIEAGTILDPYSRIGPNAKIGSETRLLYGARVHEKVCIGSYCSIAGNCPDRTTFGDHVIHLGRIAHSYYYPFADWDAPEEPGPILGSYVVVGVDALIIGPVHIDDNVFIFPQEIVRMDLPSGGIFRSGQWHDMPNWASYLRAFGKIGWKPSENKIRQ